MYMSTKNEAPTSNSSKIIAWTGIQIDRPTQFKLLTVVCAVVCGCVMVLVDGE